MNLKYKTSTLALTIAGFLAVEAHLSIAQAQIDEIIVTARKREQSLQTVPIAVSAFSGDTLAQQGISNTNQLGEIVPNLSIYTANVGLRATLRGQTLNEGLIHEDPSVNLNVDGVYIARTHGGSIPFVDIAQVEVLRGPQGTLFGRNTTGGAINMTTNLPEYEWGGEIGGRLANAQRGDAWGIINIPILEDTLAVRAAGTLLNAGGFEDEKGLLNGQSPFDQDEKQFFGSMLWEPTDNIDVIVRGDWNRADNNYFENTHLISAGSANLVANGTIGAVYGASAGTLGLTIPEVFALYGHPDPQGDELPLATNQNSFNGYQNDAAGVSATATWELEPLTIKAIGSKRWLTQFTTFDLDGTPSRALHTNQFLDHEQTTGEIQFFGDFDLIDRNMNWIAGIFYFEEEAFQGSFTDAAGSINPRTPQTIEGIGRNDSIAGFAEIDWEVIEDFRISAGGRYTVDTKYASNFNHQGFFETEALATAFSGGAPVEMIDPLFVDMLGKIRGLNTLHLTDDLPISDNPWTICRVNADVLPADGSCFVENEDTFKAFSWNFGWDWTAWDDGANSALVYANYKRSFRSGGQNFRGTFVDNSFDPEYVRQVAAGAKLDLLDGNLRFNVEGFHQKITGKQQISVIAGPSGLITLIDNASDAVVKGVEFEVNWTPLPNTIEGLQLNGSLGWTDPIYNDFPALAPANPALPVNSDPLSPGFNPVVEIDRTNDPFIRVTNLSASGSIVYNHSVFESCGGNLLTRVDMSFKSNTPLEESAVSDPNFPLRRTLNGSSTGDYFLLNARSALSMWDNTVELGIWCRNCTDTQYIQNSLDLSDSFGYAVAEPSIPRTFGADLTYRWGVGK